MIASAGSPLVRLAAGASDRRALDGGAGASHGFSVEHPVNLWINKEQGNYHYIVHSDLDFQDKRGRTAVTSMPTRER